MLVVHVHVRVTPRAGRRTSSPRRWPTPEASVAGARRAPLRRHPGPGRRRPTWCWSRSTATTTRRRPTSRRAHYATWRDTVEEMMAAPRESTRFSAVFPDRPRGRVGEREAPFEFATAGRVLVGAGRAAETCRRWWPASARGRFVCTGARPERPRRPARGAAASRAASSRCRASRPSSWPGPRLARGPRARRRRGRGHRRRQRDRPGQGGGRAAGQRRRPAGLPGGRRAAAGAITRPAAPVRRGADDRRHRAPR